jgi:hypothetical protein
MLPETSEHFWTFNSFETGTENIKYDNNKINPTKTGQMRIMMTMRSDMLRILCEVWPPLMAAPVTKDREMEVTEN